jgi:predicted nuclease of predicted toxin-antitoxin system
MRLLADENIDPALVAWLRGQGHDVMAVREAIPGATDRHVLDLAAKNERVLLTEDKDFGEMLFRRRLPSSGIILLRLRTSTREGFFHLFTSFWPDIHRQAFRHFVVVTNETLRVRPLPKLD